MTKTLQTAAQRRADRRESRQRYLDVIQHQAAVAAAKADPAGAMRRLRGRLATRRKQLLDPQYGTPRLFPKFEPGMTTTAYIRSFQALNRSQDGPALTFTHAADRPAPMEQPE